MREKKEAKIKVITAKFLYFTLTDLDSKNIIIGKRKRKRKNHFMSNSTINTKYKKNKNIEEDVNFSKNCKFLLSFVFIFDINSLWITNKIYGKITANIVLIEKAYKGLNSIDTNMKMAKKDDKIDVVLFLVTS